MLTYFCNYTSHGSTILGYLFFHIFKFLTTRSNKFFCTVNLNCSFFALFLRSKRLYGLFWGEVTKNITNCTITELRIKFDVMLFCISQ